MENQRGRLTLLLVLGMFAACAFTLAGIQAAGAQSEEDPLQGSPWKRWRITGTNLNDISAVSATDAWAVGTDGVFAHWDGAQWNIVDNTKVIGTSTIYAVDMFASNQVWATSAAGRILRYNGTNWALDPSGLGNVTMFDISMVSPTDGWAAGTSAVFAHYNGSKWLSVSPGSGITSTINGLDMVSSTLGYAVTGMADNSGRVGKIARFDGVSWQLAYTGNRILYDVDMLNAS